MNEVLSVKSMTYDYGELLQVYGLDYSPIGFYWQVGQVKHVQGWVLHLSVIRIQLHELLKVIIPYLIEQKLSFRVIRDAGLAYELLEGRLGYSALGKIVSIYPDDADAPLVAKWLQDRTVSFRGPSIPTDRHLGGIVYTRYGSINPVQMRGFNGELLNHIYDANGQLIPDPYHIPFRMPEGVNCPFENITTSSRSITRKLLNYKYYPLFTLKRDAKGDVIRAIYFRKPWQIKSCLIKQGRPNMFADDYGRDIQDRLKWQYELYLNLHKEIPFPAIFDYFQDGENTYLAMQFIKGLTLTNWIDKIYQDRSWHHLSKNERLHLIDQLLNVLYIIGRLHKRGYIHRDLTPENFLITKKGQIFLIDLELTWSSSDKPPKPPFQQGTPGHMSPEQIAAKVPTVKEDIFGIGSLAFVFLTNFYALKLVGQDITRTLGPLEFFIGDKQIAYCIAKCWASDPSERPELEEIIHNIKAFRNKIAKNEYGATKNQNIKNTFNKSEVRIVVQEGLNGLVSPGMLDPKNRWLSQIQEKELHVSNQLVGLQLCEGWHTGMAGPLWLVALAKQMEFSINCCQTPYSQSWDFIRRISSNNQEILSSGLYAGSGGIALALSEGLNSGLLVSEPNVLNQLQQCFSNTTNQANLAQGLAGQGLALLHVFNWLDKPYAEANLTSFVMMLLEKQNPDGSWNAFTGVDYGAAGIILFLLSYLEKFQNAHVKNSVHKALEWLLRIAKSNDDKYSWPVHKNTRHTDRWSLNLGIPGIILAFIKAHTVMEEPYYRTIAIHSLNKIVSYPIIIDISLGSGLAGLGELYIEAFSTFKDSYWLERASWVTKIILNCSRQTKDNTCHWVPFINEIMTADLFTGNGGIIHFLMRMMYPEDISHPLLL